MSERDDIVDDLILAAWGIDATVPDYLPIFLGVLLAIGVASGGMTSTDSPADAIKKGHPIWHASADRVRRQRAAE